MLKNEGIDYMHSSSSNTAKQTSKAEDNSIEAFSKNVEINIISKNEEEIKFDVKGIDPSLANALRRIFISEIPTMAIEKVNMWQNTSVIPDEVLAHRMGLIPIKADPRMFEYKKDKSDYDENNCIKFKLHVKCTRKSGVPPQDPSVEILPQDEEALFNHSSVYASDMTWTPIGTQAETFKNTPIRAVYEDILIAKLRPGQEIEMELICEKGIGKTHAKWSPVATAYYRLLPDISFNEEIRGEEAQELKSKWPMNVFDIEDSGKLIVKNPRDCTTWREWIRDEKYTDKVQLAKVKDHFEFTIESVGMYKPEDIVLEGINNILKNKATYWKDKLKEVDS